jgi:hypothetical protein
VRAEDAVTAHQQELQSFVREQVTPEEIIASSAVIIHDVLGIDSVRVIAVRPEYLHERTSGSPLHLSISIMMICHALIWPQPVTLGDRLLASLNQGKCTPGSTVLSEVRLPLNVQVDAETDEIYSAIKFTGLNVQKALVDLAESI